MRQKLVQGRVKQPDCHRQSVHDREQFDKILPLHWQQFRQRRTSALRVIRENHFPHRHNPLALEEHMLRPAQPDAFRSEMPRRLRIQRRFGIRPHFHAPHAIRPPHQGCEFTGEFRFQHVHLAQNYLSGRAVNRNPVAALQRHATRRHGALRIIHAQKPRARNAWLAHAACHHRRMRGHPAACRQNTFRRVHAVNILGRGFDPHENNLAPVGLGRFRLFRIQHDLTRRSTGRCRQARSDHPPLRLRVDGRVQ